MISPNPFEASRKSRRRSSNAAMIPFILIFILVVAAAIFWREPLSGLFWRAATPAIGLRNSIGANALSTLQAELASTSAALADRNALAAENETLKRLLGRKNIANEVLASVIMRPPALPYDTLMIDLGSDDGLTIGDLVFGGGTLAIGDVTDVYPTQSRVTLFSAPGRSYEAQITPRATPGSVLQVSLEGQGAGSFTGQIPAGSAATVGDPVVIAGLGNGFMGNITHLDAPNGSSFETLYIQLPVNIFSLMFVEVQKNK